MKLTVEIHPYKLEIEDEITSRVAFYSFIIRESDDPSQLEVDKFYTRFATLEHEHAVEDIRALVESMAERFGAQERLFRKERHAQALPSKMYYRPLLRLYCLRCCERVVILGNGGLKSSDLVKQSPDCYPHFLVMNAIAVAFRRIRKTCCDLPTLKSPFVLTIDPDEQDT